MSNKEIVEQLEEALRLAKKDKVELIMLKMITDKDIINFTDYSENAKTTASAIKGFYCLLLKSLKNFESFLDEEGVEVTEEEVNTIESIFKNEATN